MSVGLDIPEGESVVPENLKEYLSTLCLDGLKNFAETMHGKAKEAVAREHFCHVSCWVCKSKIFILRYFTATGKEWTGKRDQKKEKIYVTKSIPSVRLKCTCGYMRELSEEEMSNLSR